MLTEADLRGHIGKEGQWFDITIRDFLNANSLAESAMQRAMAAAPPEDADLIGEAVYLRGEAIGAALTIWQFTKDAQLKSKLETYVYVSRMQNSLATQWVPYQQKAARPAAAG